jgi:hypothetical protein
MLDASRISLGDLQTDFDNYKRNTKIELWIWRGVAVLGAGLAIYSAIKD